MKIVEGVRGVAAVQFFDDEVQEEHTEEDEKIIALSNSTMKTMRSYGKFHQECSTCFGDVERRGQRIKQIFI